MTEIVDGHLRDDRHIRPRRFARRRHRLAQFVEICERFQNQQVNAGFHQRVRLFAKRRACFRE